MSQAVRRASGTLTAGDVLKRSVGLNRRTPDCDIADLDAGWTLSVAAWRARPAGNRWLRGELLLALGSVRWTGREREGRLRSHELILQPPFTVLGAGPLDRAAPLDRHDFVRFELTARDVEWDLAVPRADTKLVRHALRRADERPPEQ